MEQIQNHQSERHRQLPQFQSGQPGNGTNERKDPKADNDLGFSPPLQFKVVMDRRHFKDAFFAELVGADLQDDGYSFSDKNTPYDDQCDGLQSQEGNRPDQAAKSK